MIYRVRATHFTFIQSILIRVPNTSISCICVVRRLNPLPLCMSIVFAIYTHRLYFKLGRVDCEVWCVCVRSFVYTHSVLYIHTYNNKKGNIRQFSMYMCCVFSMYTYIKSFQHVLVLYFSTPSMTVRCMAQYYVFSG